jgi:DnaJ-class molecular chaperone
LKNSPGELIPPDFIKIIPNLGFKHSCGIKRGDLHIKFKVLFPKQIETIDDIKTMKTILDKQVY